MARQGIADHAAGEHVFPRQGPPRKGGRVQIGPIPRGDRHIRQHLPRGAELMHMPAGDERIGGNRVAWAVGCFVPLRLAHGDQPPARGALVRSVADECRVAETLIECQGSLEQVHFEAGAADIGAVEEARLYAEIFSDRQGWKSMRAGSGEDRIDIRQRETGILYRRQCRLRQQLHGRVPWRFSGSGGADADDRRAAP